MFFCLFTFIYSNLNYLITLLCFAFVMLIRVKFGCGEGALLVIYRGWGGVVHTILEHCIIGLEGFSSISFL